MVYKKQEKPIVNIAQQKQVDEFYLPPSREELSRMYSVYSKMKAKNLVTKIGDLEVSTFVTPQDVFLNQEKKVTTFVPGYGFAIYQSGPDYGQKYYRAIKDWQEYQKYEIRRQEAEKHSGEQLA